MIKIVIITLLGIIAVQHTHATERSSAQTRAFMRLSPCPGGVDKGSTKRCRGYVVDHVKALDCGGADRPFNMQWQTISAARAKDKIERNGPECKHRTHG
jgi:hypothetical protein